MNDTLQNSVNINAETFLNIIGAEYGYLFSATAAVQEILQKIGVDSNG